ncbi:MAG: autotransporter-associated beta strand repeat-containing protein, partial [Patescibacteria group bacterium]
MKKFLAVVAILSLVFSPVTPAFAANYTTTEAGHWNDAATWGGTGSQYPHAGDTATIQNNVFVRDGATAAAASAALNGTNGMIWVSAGSGNTLTCDLTDDATVGGQRIQLNAGTALTMVGNINFQSGHAILLTGGGEGATFNFGKAGSTYTLTANIWGNTTDSIVEFLGGADVITTSGVSLKEMNINAGTVSFDGGNITATTVKFEDDGTLSLASGHSITGNVNNTSLTPKGTLTLAGGTQSVSGTVGAGHALSVINAGADSSASTFSGAVNASALNVTGDGTVTLNASSTIGTTSVHNGGALQLQNNSTVTGSASLTLNGTGISSGGALRNISDSNIWSGNITLGDHSRINSDAGTLTLSDGTISGAGKNLTVGGSGGIAIGDVIGTTTGTLTKDGSGTVTLSNANNTYTGTTTITAGTLSVGV